MTVTNRRSVRWQQWHSGTEDNDASSQLLVRAWVGVTACMEFLCIWVSSGFSGFFLAVNELTNVWTDTVCSWSSLLIHCNPDQGKRYWKVSEWVSFYDSFELDFILHGLWKIYLSYVCLINLRSKNHTPVKQLTCRLIWKHALYSQHWGV